ncbi:hypothetical protein OIN60_10410 [Paenibacillus sp. P96]|uniref:Uncharacterized protein n=1 Tax=Paenibacillus zeirhizosphaerae TaxID=2987519 RepID=A0ABT9FRV3_9BACL|nr:hypothetical protein [Paenibacillus sp. P96]MDP4097182.1 hypothetical protein [Paenibacillus sp. P96]
MKRISEIPFQVYVVEMSSIKMFILLEIGLGTLVYNLWMVLLHNALLAGTSSWVTTEAIKRTFKLLKI